MSRAIFVKSIELCEERARKQFSVVYKSVQEYVFFRERRCHETFSKLNVFTYKSIARFFLFAASHAVTVHNFREIFISKFVNFVGKSTEGSPSLNRYTDCENEWPRAETSRVRFSKSESISRFSVSDILSFPSFFFFCKGGYYRASGASVTATTFLHVNSNDLTLVQICTRTKRDSAYRVRCNRWDPAYMVSPRARAVERFHERSRG